MSKRSFPKQIRSGSCSASAILLAVSWLCLVAAQSGVRASDGENTAAQTSAPLLMEEAYYREVTTLDFSTAIEKYEAALASGTLSRSLQARALLRIGMCRRTLGDPAAATKYFERVVEEYPGERQAVQVARQLLDERSVLDPVRFMPRDVLMYAEIVEPAQPIRAAAELLRGTPLQNPIDYYMEFLETSSADLPAVTSSSRSSAAEERAAERVVPERQAPPKELRDASAFLNDAFLRDLEKLDGVAVCVPGERQQVDEFLLVLLPGDSSILRGLTQLALSMGRAPLVGSVHRLPVFRVDADRSGGDATAAVPDSRLHAAIGDALGGDVVILGRPRQRVEEAVRRYARREASLQDNAAFTEMRTSGEGSRVLCYLNPKRVDEYWLQSAGLDVVESEDNATIVEGEATPAESVDREKDDETLEGGPEEAARRARRAEQLRLRKLAEVFGWRSMRNLYLEATTNDDDTFRLHLRGGWSATDFPAWAPLRSDPFDRQILRAIPATALGYCVTGSDDGRPEGSLRGWVEAVSEALDHEINVSDRENERAALLAFAEAAESRALAAEVQSAALVVSPRLELPLPSALRLILRCNDSERALPLLENRLAEFLYAYFETNASRRFFSESITVAGEAWTVRAVEPSPAVHVRCLRLNDLLVVSLSEAGLVETIETLADPQRRATATPGACKLVCVRPASIVKEVERLTGRQSLPVPQVAEFLASEIPALYLSTHGDEEQFSLQLTLPEFTKTVRALLMKLPELR